MTNRFKYFNFGTSQHFLMAVFLLLGLTGFNFESQAAIDVGLLDELNFPTITQNPSNQTTCEDEPASFTIAADNAISYQWEESTDSGSNYAQISDGDDYAGTTTTTLTVTPLMGMSTYLYRCVVTGTTATATSMSATLMVNSEDDASFSYAAASYCPADVDQTPAVTTPGGTPCWLKFGCGYWCC